MERIIEINDPVYTFNEVVAHIDLNRIHSVIFRKTGAPHSWEAPVMFFGALFNNPLVFCLEGAAEVAALTLEPIFASIETLK